MRKHSCGKIRLVIITILCFTMLGLTACSDIPFIGDVWNGIVELSAKLNPTEENNSGEEIVYPPKNDGENSTDLEETEEDSSTDNNGGDNSTESNKFTVTFVTNCDDVIENQLITSGGKVTKPKNPIKISANTDYKFNGWYNGDKLWDFETDVVEEDITLIAYWTIENIYSDDYVIF